MLLIGTGAIGVSLAPGWITLLKAWYDIDIRVVLTRSAETMVSRQVLGSLTKNPVAGSEWRAETSSVEHKELGEWADLIIVAPATANYITKLAQGNLDSLALYVPVVAEVPVLIAPSLPGQAKSYPPVKNAMRDLQLHGMHVLCTTTGLAAHSLEPSEGGLVNIVEIVNYVRRQFGSAA